MTSHRWPAGRILAGAWLLMMVGLSPSAGQFVAPGGTAERSQAFPPPPSQNAAFPPPSGQTQAFPQPGAQSHAFPTPPGQPGGFSPVPPGAGRAPGPGPEADQVCMGFKALGQDMEQGLNAVNEAGKRKASREEACSLFKTLVVKENKALKFLETNRTRCQVPANFIKQLQERHAHIVKVRNAVCSAAPPPGAGAPSLSDALGGPTIADDSSAKRPGRGTFDTLTGNALAR